MPSTTSTRYNQFPPPKKDTLNTMPPPYPPQRSRIRLRPPPQPPRPRQPPLTPLFPPQPPPPQLPPPQLPDLPQLPDPPQPTAQSRTTPETPLPPLPPPRPTLLPVGFRYVTAAVHHNYNSPYDLAIRRTGPKTGTPFLPGLAFHNPSTHHFITLDPPLARHTRALHAHLSQLATTTPPKPKNQSLTQMQLTPIINAFFLGYAHAVPTL